MNDKQEPYQKVWRPTSEIGWRLFLGWTSSYKREEWYKYYQLNTKYKN